MKCTLNGDLTIATAAEARHRLLDTLAAGGSLELDTASVTEVDAAGLQVLLSALRTARERRITVSFASDARGDAVSAALRLIGVSDLTSAGEDTHG